MMILMHNFAINHISIYQDTIYLKKYRFQQDR